MKFSGFKVPFFISAAYPAPPQGFELTTYIQTVISLLHIKILRSFFMPVYPPYRRIHNRIKHQSDAICQRFGLEVLTPYQKPKQKSIIQREYRTALRGDSKKLKLTNAIDYAVTTIR